MLAIRESIFCFALVAFAFSGAAAEQPKKKESAPQVSVSSSRGYYEKPLLLKLTAPTGAELIRYTLNGSEPTLSNGQNYSAPLLITNTSLLRAAAFKDRTRISAVTTHSYISLDRFWHHPKEPPGLPAGPGAKPDRGSC